MEQFNAKIVKDQVVQWICDWFEENGKGCNAVLGVSGGKDSSVVAALCVEALGKDRVIGVTMPNGVQKDISDSMRLINHLGIRYCNVNIGDTCNTLMAAVKEQLATLGAEVSNQTTINMPPRVRMTTLYAVSQSMNGRVANTCNLSEDWVGYSTRYGDAAGDFAPLGGLTVGEVIAIGKELGLPDDKILNVLALHTLGVGKLLEHQIGVVLLEFLERHLVIVGLRIAELHIALREQRQHGLNLEDAVGLGGCLSLSESIETEHAGNVLLEGCTDGHSGRVVVHIPVLLAERQTALTHVHNVVDHILLVGSEARGILHAVAEGCILELQLMECIERGSRLNLIEQWLDGGDTLLVAAVDVKGQLIVIRQLLLYGALLVGLLLQFGEDGVNLLVHIVLQHVEAAIARFSCGQRMTLLPASCGKLIEIISRAYATVEVLQIDSRLALCLRTGDRCQEHEESRK